MNTPLARGMSRANELTRTSKPDEAKVLIQSLLKAANAPGGPSADDAADKPRLIEGTFARLGDASPAAPTRGGCLTRTGLSETVHRIAKHDV